jgi:hypothetical protein
LAKLPEATISVVMSVCLAVCMEQLSSHWTDFYEVLRFRVIRQSDEDVEVSLKYAQITGVSHEGAITFVIISC